MATSKLTDALFSIIGDLQDEDDATYGGLKETVIKMLRLTEHQDEDDADRELRSFCLSTVDRTLEDEGVKEFVKEWALREPGSQQELIAQALVKAYFRVVFVGLITGYKIAQADAMNERMA